MHSKVEATATCSVHIYAHHRDAAVTKLAKLAKRAAKYGQSITWTERPYTAMETHPRWDDKPVKLPVQRIELNVSGSAPKAGDYVFLAQLEMMPGGVIVSAVPGAEIGDLGFNWDGRCDHCGSNRQRRQAFVVEGPEGRKVVGKSCLRDHMGTDAPEGLLWQFAQFRDLSSDGGNEDECWGLGGYSWAESTLGVIATTRAAIALWGWRPSSHEGATTASYVDLLYGPVMRDGKGREYNAEERAALKAELRDRGDHYAAEAEAVVAWGRALGTSCRSDYERNLSVALNGDVVVSKTFNLVVSACAAYDRQVAREDEAKARREAEEAAKANQKPSYHVGQQGERVTFAVTVERVIGMPDRGFGPSTLYKLRADDGPLFAWFSSGATPRVNGKPLQQGDRATMTATVKAHDDYQGTPQTKVLRAKFAPVPNA